MIIKEEEYIQHWGIKGMKWKDTKPDNMKVKSEKERLAAEAVEAGKHGLVLERSGYGPSGYMDQHGNIYQGSLSDAIKKKKEDDTYYTKHDRPKRTLTPSQRKSANAAAQLTKQYTKPKSGAEVFLASTKAANSKKAVSNVNKGKSYVDSLFKR